MRYYVGHPPSKTEQSVFSLPPPAPTVHLVHGGSLSSRPPQLPLLRFELRRSNAVRRAAPNESVQSSFTILTQSDIEDTAVPVLQPDNNRRCWQSTVQEFSQFTYQTKKPRIMSRYYASALSTDERIVLARGDMNHNLKSWTPKDLILFEESRSNLCSPNTDIKPDPQVGIIPEIILTEGESQRVHIQQLRRQFNTARSGSTPPVPPQQFGPIAWDRAQVCARATSSGHYFLNHLRPASYHPSGYSPTFTSQARSPSSNDVSNYKLSEHTAFDTFMSPHRLGKGEINQDSKEARTLASGKKVYSKDIPKG